MHRLIHGDCIEVLKTLPSASVDLVCTDPPYDLAEEQKCFLHAEFMRVSRHGAIVFSPPENPWLPADQYGFWVKPISTKNTSKRYSRFVEMIFLYGPLKWRTGRHWSQYTNVFLDLVDGETVHPFEKPMSLIKRLLLNHSDRGDVVLDPFVGSGTTALVATLLGRRCIGIEREIAYFDIACSRIDAAQPKTLKGDKPCVEVTGRFLAREITAGIVPTG